MSTSTVDRPAATISITDINGIEQNPTFIEDQPLEKYFADNPILSAPTGDQVAFADGLPANLDLPVDPFASVGVGLMADRG